MLRIVAVLVFVALAGCGGDSSGEGSRGGAGIRVETHETTNSTYFQASANGQYQLRPQYQGILTTYCSAPPLYCLMPFAIAVGSQCYCVDSWTGMTYWGQAR